MNNPRKPRSTSSPSTSPGVSVREVLEQADIYALRAFLRQETKRNKVLSIKLKAHLIDSIASEYEQGRYAAVLGELIKSNERGIVPLAKREVKLVLDVCSIFLEKARNHLAEKAYLQACEAIFGMLAPLHTYVGKSQQDDDDLREMLLSIYLELHKLVRADLAPELKDDIYTRGVGLIDKFYYKPLVIDNNLISAVMLTQSDAVEIGKLYRILAEKLTKQADPVTYGFWYAIVADASGHQLDTILLSQVLEPLDVFRIAEQLDQRGLISARNRWVAEFSADFGNAGSRSIQWKRWKFDAFLSGLKGDNMLEVGLSLLSDTKDLEYFEGLARKFSTRKIIDHLTANEDYRLVTDILVHVGKWREFERLMVKLGDLDLVTRHIDAILANVKDPMAFLTRILQDYLIHHAGHLCSERLNDLLLTLESKGHYPLSDELKADIQTAFPGRFKLTEVGLNISY